MRMSLYRVGCLAGLCLPVIASLVGCQSASLEAAAPSAALPPPVVSADAPSAQATPAVTASPRPNLPQTTAPATTPTPALAQAPASSPQTGNSVASAALPTVAQPASTVERRNPGIVSIVPIERTNDPQRADFVAQGARDTGAFPNIGVQPTTATTQMSAAEKYEQEARMLEILRNRENNASTRAAYDRRVAELRRLARTHAQEVERQIEN